SAVRRNLTKNRLSSTRFPFCRIWRIFENHYAGNFLMADFIDFMMEGGDDLLNRHECLHCKRSFHVDEAKKVDSETNKVLCPRCGKVVEV
ncbi:MAG: hypothetical protein WCG06_04135, partial [Candidatus Omnitrophota bacterium]